MPRNSPEVKRAIHGSKSYPPRLKLLDTQREDGTWEISRTRRMAEEAGPGPPIGWTYTTMLRNLHMLNEYLTTPDEGHVRVALEKILSWQDDEGYIPGPWGSFPLPHHNGYALRNLSAYGMLDDPRVKKLTRWLFSIQREDGGWLIPYMEDVKYLPEYKKMKMAQFLKLVDQGKVRYGDESRYEHIPSCLWTTLMVVRGLEWNPELAKDRRVWKGASFVLDGFFKKNYHQAFLSSAKHWTTLKYPSYLGGGLCALDILTDMGYGPNDQRMHKPIMWLLGARSKNGFWHQSERPQKEKDQWITQIALSVLSKYSRKL
jgi:hypothetical protein